VFDSAEHAASLYNLQTFGNVYSRISNPTVAVFEERMARWKAGARAGDVDGAGGRSHRDAHALQAGRPHRLRLDALRRHAHLLHVNLKKLGIETTFVAPD
jgi:O-acetylhomoserine (thiol)-lyase